MIHGSWVTMRSRRKKARLVSGRGHMHHCLLSRSVENPHRASRLAEVEQIERCALVHGIAARTHIVNDRSIRALGSLAPRGAHMEKRSRLLQRVLRIYAGWHDMSAANGGCVHATATKAW